MRLRHRTACASEPEDVSADERASVRFTRLVNNKLVDVSDLVINAERRNAPEHRSRWNEQHIEKVQFLAIAPHVQLLLFDRVIEIACCPVAVVTIAVRVRLHHRPFTRERPLRFRAQALALDLAHRLYVVHVHPRLWDLTLDVRVLVTVDAEVSMFKRLRQAPCGFSELPTTTCPPALVRITPTRSVAANVVQANLLNVWAIITLNFYLICFACGVGSIRRNWL